MAKDSKSPQDPDKFDDIVHERSGPRPDYSKPLPRTKLPAELQNTFDSEEKWWDVFSSGKAEDSTDSSVRYAAYASRLRTILVAGQRYVAYTSDIGESFRPVAHPNWVRAAYGISWSYLIGDVANEGYKAYTRNQQALNPASAPDNLPPSQIVPNTPTVRVAAIDDWRTVVVQRAIFQSIASMGLPAFTIHSIVRYSGRAMKDLKNVRLRTWGPIGLGLAAVPALPFLFDKPVEHATEWLFHNAFLAVGGPDAVGHRSAEETVKEGTGRRKEKEL